MPHVSLDEVEAIVVSGTDGFSPIETNSRDTVEATVKYSSYLRRQIAEMDSWRKSQGLVIPGDIAFDRVSFPGLKDEEVRAESAVTSSQIISNKRSLVVSARAAEEAQAQHPG